MSIDGRHQPAALIQRKREVCDQAEDRHREGNGDEVVTRRQNLISRTPSGGV
jgi:hypothetical protein